jgi:hypothetical protein
MASLYRLIYINCNIRVYIPGYRLLSVSEGRIIGI